MEYTKKYVQKLEAERDSLLEQIEVLRQERNELIALLEDADAETMLYYRKALDSNSSDESIDWSKETVGQSGC